jgi:hypothetical protein
MAHPEITSDVWNVPGRNPNFTGRQLLLDRVRNGLAGGRTIAVTALHGLGGIGKTQIAVEYAYRHAAEYQLVWWINAEQIALVEAQLAALASRLGLTVSGKAPDDASAALDTLRKRGDWLLIFDNAESPAALRPWIPSGSGHTLITSRNPAWSELAERVEVAVLPRSEAIALLHRRIIDVVPETADALASTLGDLPLALAQASAYLETTSIPPDAYLDRFRSRREQMLAKGTDVAYGGTVSTAWSLALEQLRYQAPAAVQLLELFAHLGPEAIPLTLITNHADLLTPPLRDVVAGTDSADDIDDIVGTLLAYSLVRRDGANIQVHRLVQAVICMHQTTERQDATAAAVRGLLVAHLPAGRVEDAGNWPAWAELTPHILAAPSVHPKDSRVDIGSDARKLLLRTSWYLHLCGNLSGARALSTSLHSRWNITLGREHPDTLKAASHLAAHLATLGDAATARHLNEETLACRRRLLGEDHPDTLTSANNLALVLADLDDAAGALTLLEDTLARRRRLLGDEHPDSLISASNLALGLRMAGDASAAHQLDRETWSSRRKLFGDDNSETLKSASNLARDLWLLGDAANARILLEDVLARRRRLLGDEHPDTVNTASGLSEISRELGEEAIAEAC